MKNIFSLFLFFNVICIFCVRSEEVVLATVYDTEKNYQLKWVMPQKDFEELPKYCVRKGGDKLLPLMEAIQIAKQFCEKNYPDAKIKLDAASFRQPISVKSRNNIFFYFITFEVVNKSGKIEEYDVLVLPNKNILQAKKNE